MIRANFFIKEITQFLKQDFTRSFVVVFAKVKAKFAKFLIVESVPKLELVKVLRKDLRQLLRIDTAGDNAANQVQVSILWTVLSRKGCV